MNKNIGIYIHIPFCASKCYYCDFTSYCNRDEVIQDYINSVCNEILKNVEILSSYHIITVYFGGGTPSYINSNYIVQIMEVLKLLQKDEDEFREVTIELNPNSITEEKLKDYLNCGINRFSIGLQSTHNDILKNIGRKHTFDDFKHSCSLFKKLNITNVSLDIMYPLPGLTIERFHETLNQVIDISKEYAIEHISSYNLEVHPNTKLDFLLKNGFLSLPNEDEEYEMRNLLINTLEKAGWKQYEISNFAKPGYESLHNLNYWNQGEYLGFGVAASSFFDGSRYTNTNSIEDYIESMATSTSTVIEKDDLDKLDLMKEYIILKLRLKEGIDIDKFKTKFNSDIFDLFEQELDYLISNRLLIHDDKQIYLSDRGKEVANLVWEKFI
ncbi:MAG: radical SAM family heme chaperone HemW [Clostridia bacterium]|nr:radical SAM family heme chaperone HemW [Clostridia bacterium]